MKRNILKRIRAIREEVKKPIPEPITTKSKEKKMAKKASAKKKVTKKTSAKGKAKKSTSQKTSPKKTSTDVSSEVTLTELAKKAKMSTQKARQKLRAAGVERTDGKRWSWGEKSKGLKAAQKALGL